MALTLSEAAKLSVGHDGPGRFAGVQQGNHTSAGVLSGGLCIIMGLIAPIQIPVPCVCQTHGHRLVWNLRGVQTVVRPGSISTSHLRDCLES